MEERRQEDRSELRFFGTLGIRLCFLCFALLFVTVLWNWTAGVNRVVYDSSNFVVFIGIRKELFPVIDRLDEIRSKVGDE